MTVNKILDLMPMAAAKGTDGGTASVSEDKTDFAAQLSQAAKAPDSSVKESGEPARQIEPAGEEQLQPTEPEDGEEKEQVQSTEAQIVVAALPITVNTEQTAETAAAQQAFEQPVQQVQVTQADAGQIQADQPQQTQPLQTAETDVKFADVKAEAEEILSTEARQAQDAPKTAEPGAAIAIGDDVNTDTLKFVKQALEETDEMLAQPKQAQPEAKAEQKSAPIVGQGNVETQAAAEATAAKDGEQSADAGKQTKTAQTEQPITANIAADGKVEFKLSATRQSAVPEAALPRGSVQGQIVRQVSTMVTSERSELTLELTPEHLGGLKIALASGENGLTAKLVTANKDVHNMIQGEMTQMQETLRERGINVMQMEVVYDQMASATDAQDTNNGGREWGGSARGSHGRMPERAESVRMMYDEITQYEVLAEQGGSVEFSA